MSDFTKSTAVFSGDKLYRYTLERWWSPFAKGHYLNVVALNPSTATAEVEDPTVRRMIGYARDWGYDGLIVTNLFALRSTDPKQLKKVTDPVGPENNKYLLDVASRAGMVLCGWGNWGRLKNRGAWVESMLRQAGVKLHCLGKTHAYRTKAESPQPRHPLYLKSDTKPELYL